MRSSPTTLDHRPATPGGVHRSPSRVVLAGCGSTSLAVLHGLPMEWRAVVIDTDAAATMAGTTVRPDAMTVVGDATSRLVLGKVELEPDDTLIAATDDDDVNLEVVRVARALCPGVVVVCVLRAPSRGSEAGLSPAEVLPRGEAIAARIVPRFGGWMSRAVGVGQGAGEIVEVVILDGSGAIGRRLHEIGATHWLVAAVYRDGQLIVPHGDTALIAGDRVVLVGPPELLVQVARFVRGGAPVFPHQFGSVIAATHTDVRDEARWLAEVVDAACVDVPLPRGVDVDPNEYAVSLARVHAGVVVRQARALPWFVRAGLVSSRAHEEVVAAARPVLVARNGGPWRRVVLAVRDARAQAVVVHVAFDLARIAGVPLRAVVVEPPSVSGDQAPTTRNVEPEVQRMARLHELDVQTERLLGNPVRVLRAAVQPDDVLVVGIRPSRAGPLTPDVSVHLLHDVRCSVLFVPWRGDPA